MRSCILPLTAVLAALLLAGCGDGDPYPPGTSSATYGTSGGGTSGGTSSGSSGTYTNNPDLKASAMTGTWNGSMQLTANAVTRGPTSRLTSLLAVLSQAPTSQAISPSTPPTGSFTIGFVLKQYATGGITGDFSDNMTAENTLDGTSVISGDGGSTTTSVVTVTATNGKAVFTGTVSSEVWSGTVEVMDPASTVVSHGTFSVTRQSDTTSIFPLESRLIEDSPDDFDHETFSPQGPVIYFANSTSFARYFDSVSTAGVPDRMAWWAPVMAGSYRTRVRLFSGNTFSSYNNGLRVEIYQYGILMSTPMRMTITTNVRPTSVSDGQGGSGPVVGEYTLRVVP